MFMNKQKLLLENVVIAKTILYESHSISPLLSVELFRLLIEGYITLVAVYAEIENICIACLNTQFFYG